MRRTHSRPPAAREARAAFQPLERRVLFAAGDLDTTFGGDGLVHGNPAEFAGRIAAIAVQSDGKTVAVGSSTPAQTFGVRAAVLRYNADGSFDTTFGGGDGIVLFDRFEGRTDFSRLTDVEILPNGDIVAAGTATEAQPDGTARASNIAVRLNSTGGGVPTFGESGLAAVSTAGGTFLRQRVALDALPSGEVFIAGQTQTEPDSARAAVIKLTSVGTLDTTFGSAEHPGMWRQPVDDSRSDYAGARDVQVLPDGRILVAGDVDDRREAFVVRLTPNGAEDALFGGGDGTVWLDYGAPATRRTEVTGNAIALQGDGKIVLAGSIEFVDERGGFRVTRLNPDGSIDTPFGDNGMRAFGFPGVDSMPTEVKVQADGKIVAAGFSTRFSTPGFVIGRLEADGDMDYTFGDRGRVFTPERVGDSNIEDVHNPVDMDLRPDGKIVMSGNSPFPENGSDQDNTPVFARYLNDSTTVPPPTGGVTVQAENGGPFTGAFVSQSNSGYTGSGYVDFSADNGGSATWNVSGLGGPGDYVVEFRYANGSSSRTLQFEATPGAPAKNVSFASTGAWTNWSTVSVSATVGGASNSLAVVLRTIGQNGPNIDSLTVRKTGTTPPTGSTFQAEQATVVGAQVASNTQGYTGTGFVDFQHNTGDSIEWTFNDPGGSRTLSFRYANGSSDRPLELRVNGQVINPRLSFAPTGSWNTWREVSVTVNLAAGNNRVKLTSVGSNGGNIDALSVR